MDVIERPSLEIKEIADKAAELIAKNDKENLKAYLDELKQHSKSLYNSEKAPVSLVGNGSMKVGIWKQETSNGKNGWVRDNDLSDDWIFWAANNRIPPKTDAFRVVFLGESVARGFLYEPYYTPANVLSEILNNAQHDRNVEVVDLAKTDMNLEGLAETCKESLHLDPDAIVLFAGNNWSPPATGLSEEDVNRLLDNIDSKEISEVYKEIIERILKTKITGFLEDLGKIKATRDIPILFIIPEFNLLDWRASEKENSVSALNGRDTVKWIELRDHTRKLMEDELWEKALDEAGKMIQVDASHPLGHEYKGDCLLQMDRTSDARSAYEAARDTSMFGRTGDSKPRMFRISREVILEHAPHQGIDVIDSVDLFDSYLDRKLPDRRIFLDYCHLSSEGIQVTMAAIANQLIGHISPLSQDIPVEPVYPKPDNDKEAFARFSAAIHNAHWGQSYPVVLHHVKEAIIQSDDQFREFLRLYCDMATRKVSAHLASSFEQMILTGLLDQYMHLMHPKNGKPMDIDLADAIASICDSKEEKWIDELRSLRINEHAADDRPINLLDSFYHQSSYERIFHDRGYAFFRAHDNVTNFFLVATPKSSIECNISLRIPTLGNTKSEEVSIWVNDNHICDISASAGWGRQTFRIPQEALSSGINRLTLKWPLPVDGTPRKVHHSIGTALGIISSLFHTFGEIYTFEARPV